MPVKIRLQRHGKKGKPFYWIVAADVRAKRDGKFLEKLGIYNPNTNPATVEVNVEQALEWLQNGAQPTNTARTLLSYRGVMYKHHLQGGVSKGALTQEEAEKKFDAWLEEKNAKIQSKVDGLTKQADESRSVRLAAEKEISDKRKAAALEAAAEQTEETATEETTTEATPADAAPVAEETPTEAVNTEKVEDNATPAEEAPQEEEAPEATASEDEKSTEETPEATQENSEKESDKEE
ncbi:MAG: 30S ribosomal protein S16 [Flavobacteriales bacterium MED-G22]|nr:MAG: 30S ribosomal protein S16 [Flavobacteriales bacterium MED-G22]|tara:strand:- start:933 stop:1643 length:711 start_codon:yes stop_codon:yes gene_type:complete